MNKDGQIIVTVGISNSGKSTWAHDCWKALPEKIAVVNRDKIRELLFGYTEATIQDYYKREDLNKLEKQITKYEDTLIHEALVEGKSVIVDATHLDKKYIERYRFWNVPVELVWFDVTLKEAFTRNMGRERKVDETVIGKQYAKYINLRKDPSLNVNGFLYTPSMIELDTTLPPVYLLDIDGTIAHMNGKRGAFDWKQVGVDDVCPALLPTVQAITHFEGMDLGGVAPALIVVSGRDAVCKVETEQWLAQKGVLYDMLHMRPEKDMRPDWQIKEEIWRDIAKEYNILALFDDRLQVVRRARALGLKVFNVEYNNF